jgi:hypothetical protein
MAVMDRRYRMMRHLMPPGTKPIAKKFKDANNRLRRPESGEINK